MQTQKSTSPQTLSSSQAFSETASARTGALKPPFRRYPIHTPCERTTEPYPSHACLIQCPPTWPGTYRQGRVFSPHRCVAGKCQTQMPDCRFALSLHERKHISPIPAFLAKPFTSDEQHPFVQLPWPSGVVPVMADRQHPYLQPSEGVKPFTSEKQHSLYFFNLQMRVFVT